MSEVQTILQLGDKEIDAMIKLLLPLDSQLKQRLAYVVNKMHLSRKEAFEYIVTDNPILWAKVYLDWEVRDYQIPIITEAKKSRQLVLRLGRRLGKTDCMCVMILWYAYTQYNRGPNNQYDIMIVAPSKEQVELVFDRMHQLIDSSSLMQSLMTRDVYLRYEFDINGITSKVHGFTAGTNNASAGAINTRGQRADVLVLDECDYIGSSPITNILNIRNEAPERIKLLCASTPSGKHEEYYRWCTGATRTYSPLTEDIKNNRFSKYNIIERPVGEGNGWTQIYAPSNVNKELLKVNPDTERTYLEDIREEISEMRYTQEVMAEFGEEEMGVYQKKYIEQAIEEGRRLGFRHITKWSKQDREKYLKSTQGVNIRLLGVDWDRMSCPA